MKDLPIQYQEADLVDVIDFYSKAFKPKPGTHIYHVEYLLDPTAKKVVFKLFVSNIREGGIS